MLADNVFTGEARTGGVLLRCRGSLGPQEVSELAIAPRGHGQDELQRLATRYPQPGQYLQVIQREQPAVGYHHEAADVREALQHPLEEGFERGRLGGVALEHSW